MIRALISFSLFAASSACYAQMTLDQKMVDFQDLAALFSKRYAFLEWKHDAVGFDGLQLAPWIERIKKSKDDLEFFEICTEYVTAYRDGHTGFELPSTFQAQLGFTADLYDDKVLIDHIDRKTLKVTDFPAEVGDELVSLDGKTPAAIMADSMRFIGEGNPRTARRIAAALLTSRNQYYGPRAHQIGERAEVVVRRQSGATETYSVAWRKEGMAYSSAGPVPDPRMSSFRARSQAGQAPNPSLLERLRTFRSQRRFYLGVDQMQPLFTIDGFKPRMGTGRYDMLYTGIFDAGGMTFGFVRIPDFEYVPTSDLEKELAYFQANTAGLVIDVMSNPGGYGCAAEETLAHLMPDGYYSIGNSMRATWSDILSVQMELDYARQSSKATDEDIAALETMLTQLQRAYAENRGFTPPLPVCGDSLVINATLDKKGNNIAYTKPILLLVDELSASAAEIFAAIMQDEKRGLVYGLRTAGAGGSVGDANVGFYMEGAASYAQSILVRKNQIASPEFPAARYIENIAVIPDVSADLMTADNLLNQGKTFVNGFSKALVDYVNSRK